jgi:hypothetical protein
MTTTVDLKDTGCKPQAHGQSEPGGGRCPRCDRPRCSAAAKTRPGERCRKNPHPGATICTNHGLTAAGRAAAEQRQVEAEAVKVIGRLWNPDAVPVTNAVDAMQKLAGRLGHACEVLGHRLESGEPCSVCGRGDLQLDSAAAAAWLRILRENRQLLVDMERLGIAQRFVQLEQDRVRLVAAAVGRVFEVLGLTAEQRLEGTRVLLAELRASSMPPDEAA